MTERFLVRTEGGPCHGETRIANAHGDEGWTWPLPDELKYGATGSYVKYSESDAPRQPDDSRVIRGAVYRWEPKARVGVPERMPIPVSHYCDDPETCAVCGDQQVILTPEFWDAQ